MSESELRLAQDFKMEAIKIMSKINDGISTVENKITSFLLIGQSNMAGRGDFGEVPEIINKNCFMLRMGRWQQMREPINCDRQIFEGSFHSGISLAASFADELQKATDSPIGLIPCADGGTTIEQWMPGEVLFDHAAMMTNLAKRTSNLGGILWHQGENNCIDFDPAGYKEKLIAMMTELRAIIGAEKKPLLIGELSLGTSKEFDWAENIPAMNKIFHEVAEILPYCGVVSSEGLSMKPDGIHFDSAALRIFGHRYFEKYMEIASR